MSSDQTYKDEREREEREKWLLAEEAKLRELKKRKFLVEMIIDINSPEISTTYAKYRLQAVPGVYSVKLV